MTLATPMRTGPALCRGLVLVETPDGLVIEGGPHRMLLGGEAVTGFLRGLLPLLDGRHAPEELCDLLAVEPSALTSALALLDDWGVLESGGTVREWAVPAETVLYHSRTAALTGGHRSGDSVLEELSRAHVLLVADGPLTRELDEDLTASGVGRVSTARGTSGRLEEYDLVVVADRPAVTGRLEDWVAATRHRGIPVLRLGTGPGTIEIGPLFWPGESACVDCFRRGGGSADEPFGPDDGRGLLVAAAAMEVLAVLARTTPVTTLNALARTAIAGDRTERTIFAPDASCAECADADDRAADEAVRLFDAYEWHLAQPPRRLTPAPRPLAPRQQQLRRAANHRVTLPTSPSAGLPAPPDVAASHDRQGDGLYGADVLTTLAALLPHTTGATAADRDVQRDEPVPASVLAYVLGEFTSCDLPGQVFLYDDIRHRLLSVRADSPMWRDALLASGSSVDAACPVAAIVLVADAGALAAGYGDGAWRQAHAEAGIAAMDLALAAQGQGVALSFGLGWSGDLPGMLELDPTRQSVAVVAGLTGGRGAQGARR
ncbi:hypothetical protein [Streptomyces pseudovenezuelae]|uniref:hypothetical protein n=1 Tax=Streptomyces pseudovenezuelae TaxID=67350 RepID=UPI002E80A30D|nr:hypothetical protein [Streptomyces pseudovenezuelae]WUA85907.1 hypothetical protein OHO81_00715 [Streptomyces pseudovenezuelae]